MMDALSERILAVEAPGGPVARLQVVVPSIVGPGEPFTVKLAALDAKAYPSVECDDAAHSVAGPARGVPESVPFAGGRPAIAFIEGVTLPEEGLYRLGFDLGGETYLSNPVLVDAAMDERIFWGDPHVHTVLSSCHPTQCRSLEFCFVAARWMSALDWVCAADHVSNGRSDKGKWEAQRRAVRIFDQPPDFAAILGYEASLRGGCGGDNNVYCRGDLEDFVDCYEDGDTRTLSEALADEECFIVPHHTTRTGKHGELNDRTYLGPERMPVVEIHSKWGTSEYRGNPNALHEVHDGPGHVQDHLAQGYPLGFIAGTDTHATMPSSYGDDSAHIDRLPGFTAVRAHALSREAVYDNIKARNCYATSAERILITGLSIANVGMGAELPWLVPSMPREVRANIAAESDIERVDVVRNGIDVFSMTGDGWRARLTWTDEQDLVQVAFEPRGYFDRPFVYYYIRVTCGSGAQAWTSPMWVTL
ncbi:MAG: hypothetical protein J7M38_00325 [Armatimonadetes bacterium]|nr:hypothetical protein [Armatimonadota bacterium]